MKTLIFSVIMTLFACMNQVENKDLDHVFLPNIDTKEELAPDTFIPVANEELVVSTKPSVDEPNSNIEKKEILIEKGQDSPVTVKPSSTLSKGSDNQVLKEEKSSQDAEIADTKPITQASESTSAPESTKPQKFETQIETKVETNTTTSNDTDIVEATEKETIIVEEKKTVVEEVAIAKPDHSIFAKLLKAHVSNSGDVNYKGIKSAESTLDAYITELDKHSIQPDWTKNEQLAYWMNAYNAFTIKLILNNYPVSKITDLHGGKPWDVKWIKLGGKTYSLNTIEHDIIRPTFNDARIHFAVNCAAKSCPPLLNDAYTGQNVNRLLNHVTKAFVNSSANQISSNTVQLSKIFDWYGDDFGNLIDFLNQYSSKTIDSNAKIGYLDYNWSLNEG